VKEVYSFNEIEGCKNWNDLLILGVDTGNQSEVEDRKQCNQRFPLSYILLVQQEDQRRMLSHQNIVSNVLTVPLEFLEAGKPVH
jgi:long-chain acyl-CoA synthetase